VARVAQVAWSGMGWCGRDCAGWDAAGGVG